MSMLSLQSIGPYRIRYPDQTGLMNFKTFMKRRKIGINWWKYAKDVQLYITMMS